METPTPMKGATPRQSGSHLTPEGVPTRSTAESPKYPKAGVPNPGQSLAAGPSGAHDKGWTHPSVKRATPVVTAEGKGSGRPTGSTKTISRRSGGSDASKI